MTRTELEQAVARATGESRRTIQRYGFSIVPDELESPPKLRLVMDCPGCGAAVPYHEASASLPDLAECLRCDAAYPYQVGELYVIPQKRIEHDVVRHRSR